MKKLYRKSTVHPSPPFISDQLAFLPATILTLTAALSSEDREVLAYLLSSSCSVTSDNFPTHRKTSKGGGGGGGGGCDHPPSFTCSCFRCYMSYWVRWDSSPNRELIHEIIDAFEDGLVMKCNNKGTTTVNNNNHNHNNNNKRERRSKKGNNNNNNNRSGEFNRREMSSGRDELTESGESESVEKVSTGNVCVDDGEEGIEKGSVRKFVSFIGERIWSVWI